MKIINHRKCSHTLFIIILYLCMFTFNVSAEQYSIEKMNTIPSPYQDEYYRKLQGTSPDPILINEILSALTSSSNKYVRMNCATILLPLKNNSQAIQALITALETEQDPFVKLSIVAVIGDIRSPSTVKALEKFVLYNEDIIGHHGYQVRAEAIQALGKCGTAATASLIAISKNTTIWKTDGGKIVVALGLTGDETAIPKIIEGMKDSDYNIRAAAAYAATILVSYYSQKTKDDIFNALIELVDDEAFMVRNSVAGSFEKLGDIRAKPYLEKLAKDQYNAVYTISKGNVTWDEKKYPVREAAKEAIRKLELIQTNATSTAALSQTNTK